MYTLPLVVGVVPVHFQHIMPKAAIGAAAAVETNSGVVVWSRPVVLVRQTGARNPSVPGSVATSLPPLEGGGSCRSRRHVLPLKKDFAIRFNIIL